MATRQQSRNDYTIGWVCALPKEQTAAILMLDEEHPELPTSERDENIYTLGSIGEHNIVITCLPKGQYGNISAAGIATQLVNSFPSIKFALMVGIGGGIPPKVRLGDVVVGSPKDQHGGVIQWDLGKAIDGGKFQRTGYLNSPPKCVLAALTKLESKFALGIWTRIQHHLDLAGKSYPDIKAKYLSPDTLQDVLFKSNYSHIENEPRRTWIGVIYTWIASILWWLLRVNIGNYRPSEKDQLYENSSNDDTCRFCDKTQVLCREPRGREIHYGLIASGDQVVKDAVYRDALCKELGDVLCIEMEAAGLVRNFPCMVIRGICDYADSHKNKAWQEYAAIVAAAFAKELLGFVRASSVAQEPTMKSLLDVVTCIKEDVEYAKSDLKFIRQNTVEESMKNHHRDIEKWLSPAQPVTNFQTALRQRNEGSGRWLLQHPAYLAWKAAGANSIWLNGIPGCGKTILSATVIEDLLESQGLESSVLYFYFDFSDTRKQFLEDAVRTLTFQLYSQHSEVRKHLEMLFSSCSDGSYQPTTESLCHTFECMLQQQTEVWIVLDALDECNNRTRDLFPWIKSLHDQQSTRLLLTSRPEQDIESIIEIWDYCEIMSLQSNLVEEDILSYIHGQVYDTTRLVRWHKHPEIQQEIESVLANNAHGMFRWVTCQLDELEHCLNPRAVRDALNTLPKTLHDTYSRILTNIPRMYLREAKCLLQFLAYSERPMRIEEAVDALAVDITETPCFDPKSRMPDPKEISRYCGSLVVMVERKSNGEIYGEDYNEDDYEGKAIIELRLAHFSVKDYITSDPAKHNLADDLQKNLFNDLEEPTARVSIIRTSLAYLLQVDSSNAWEYPMARFAAQCWTNHAMEVHKKFQHKIPDIEPTMRRFFTSHEAYRLFYRLYCPGIFLGNKRLSPLDYASSYGFVTCVQYLLDNSANVNTVANCSRALQAASAGGHREIVQLLLDRGADVNKVMDSRLGYRSALHMASNQGHREIVQLLLDRGADVNTVSEYSAPLQTASDQGHREVVQLLLDRGADVNTQMDSRSRYRSALYMASAGGYREIVQLLLDRGADVNILTDGLYGTALTAASCRGHCEIVQVLLDRGADVNMTMKYGSYGTALAAASGEGHREIVQVLLNRGADVNITVDNRYGFKTALTAASGGGHCEIVQLLLDRGADVNAVTYSYYGTALAAASGAGHREIVQLLLDRGADVNTVANSCTALMVALGQGHHEIVQVLLENGADLEKAVTVGHD
ncbi:hypothetical protein BX600DRAFT_420393 [Xylariales sp. PMI_506]|nr:hypothetical protein BX600DRAFT_420393 [Xylariales sp. PMI_506]